MLTPLTEYTDYVRELETRLTQYFQQEAPYIVCKKGCSYCCKNGLYPVSEIEFKFLKQGIDKLDKHHARTVKRRVARISKQHKKYNNIANQKAPFKYHCPFLIDNVCSVYEFRPLICRSYGLIVQDDEKTQMQVPSCLKEGLNYATVADPKTCTFSDDKIKALGAPAPQGYDVSHESLIRNLSHGKVRMIYEWVMEHSI